MFLTTIAICFWILALIAQTRALWWLGHRIATQHLTTSQWRDYAWAAPLLTAHAVMLLHRLRRVATRQGETKRNLALESRGVLLANALRTQPARILNTSGEATYARRDLVGRPTILVAAAHRQVLTDAELDALLLHELYHLKRHTLLINALRFFSSITLCGGGLLGNVIDPARMEFDADRAAARALDRLGQPGAVTVQTTLAKLGALRTKAAFSKTGQTTNATQSTMHILHALFFGEGVLWYSHPDLADRIAALNELTPCHN